ncbi:MAG: hypothetical protein M3541_00315 [Acidobacteriota bacterium]|jgi:hypothetical protein|nr:hypothetical protein [Acidobacteriota bacterium]
MSASPQDLAPAPAKAPDRLQSTQHRHQNTPLLVSVIHVVDIESTLRFLEQKWHTGWGLASALIAAATLFALIIPDEELRWRLGAIALASAAIALTWILGWRPRKAKSDAVGLVICVACGPNTKSRHMRDEFVATFRSLIKGGPTGSTFDVVEIPDHIAAGIQDDEAAAKLRVRTRAHMVLFGRVRIRQSGGEPVATTSYR